MERGKNIMKAWIKDKRQAGAVLTEREIPSIKRDEVLIKVEASALCKSDVDVYEWMAVFGSLILGAIVLYAIYAGRRPKG